MSQILLSIITATYNAEATIERTLRSVETQIYDWAIEHIVVDGDSQDNTMAIVNKYKNSPHNYNVIVISEPDKGLYDALNKGLHSASGEFVCFLNAGDTFKNESTIEQLFAGKDTDEIGIIYGDTDIVDDNGVFLRNRRLSPPKHLCWKSFKSGMLVCHQSFIPKRELCPDYDLTYRYSADFDWCIRVMKKTEEQNLSNLFSETTITNYLNEGMTTKNRTASLKERFHIMVKHYGWLTTILHHIWFIIRIVIKH